MNESERFFPLSKASPHCVGHPHIGTLTRWALRGVGPERVKLKTWKIGGRRYTTREAIDRFVSQLSGEAETVATLSRRRADEVAQAEESLDSDGLV